MTEALLNCPYWRSSLTVVVSPAASAGVATSSSNCPASSLRKRVMLAGASALPALRTSAKMSHRVSAVESSP